MNGKSDESTATDVQRESRSMLKLIISVAGGALVGYLYHRFVGCRSGACPITANPIASSLYGALIGFLLARS